MPVTSGLGRASSPRPETVVAELTLDQAAKLAEEYSSRGLEKELATLRGEWGDEVEAAARNPDYRVRSLAFRSLAQFRFRQKIELLRRGLDDESPGVRGSALIALESFSRDHPGDVNKLPAAAARARGPRSERRRAPAGDRLPEERVTRARHDPAARRDRRERRGRRRGAAHRPLGVDAPREALARQVGSARWPASRSWA